MKKIFLFIAVAAMSITASATDLWTGSQHVSWAEGGLQIAAAFEHEFHTGHPGRIETAQVKACQTSALIEHINHTGHLTGVQVFHSLNGFKVTHIIKPRVRGRRARVSERGVKDHPSHIGIAAVNYPIRLIVSIVQVVGSARAAKAQPIVVEGQRRVRRRVARIGFRLIGIPGEVTRVIGAAVDVGVGLVHRVG